MFVESITITRLLPLPVAQILARVISNMHHDLTQTKFGMERVNIDMARIKSFVGLAAAADGHDARPRQSSFATTVPITMCTRREQCDWCD
jgi:hypothetical protein